MMSLGILLNVINCIINLPQKLVTQLIGYLRLHRGDITRILRCTGMNNKWLHAATQRPQSLRNSSLVTPTTAPESISADR